jgi:H+/Cl- antiporter ClcA
MADLPATPADPLHKRVENLYAYALAALVGALAGLIAACFHWVLDFLAVKRSAIHAELPNFHLAGLTIPTWIPMALASGLLVCLALWLVRRFAPEAHGSGIPQVETILSDRGKIRWWRIIPVKFVSSICAIAPGLLLGREGPTIHMGAACGEAVAALGSTAEKHRKPLIAAGVAAGLAAAFNAPLAGILLVTEEMRKEFDNTRVSLLCVIIASCAAIVVNSSWLGQGLDLHLPPMARAPLLELPLYLLLGIVAGVFAVTFNRSLLFAVAWFNTLNSKGTYLAALTVGVAVGILVWFLPEVVGGGERLVEQQVETNQTLLMLMSVLILRMLLSAICYGTGVAGGIFAPLLALGALLGLIFGTAVASFLPELASTPGMFIVAAMGAMFAGTVRAPLTGIVLILELTGAYDATLTILITCMTASLAAQMLDGKPIYGELRRVSAQQPQRLL